MHKRLAIGLILVSLILTISLTGVGETKVKAYRNINFKDSIETVKEKIEDDSRIKLDSVYSSFVFGSTAIGEFTYGLSFHFYNNELYEVDFRSPDLPKDYFRVVKDARNQLVAIIRRQYGSPTWNKVGHFGFSDIDPEEVLDPSHTWSTDATNAKKRVELGYSITASTKEVDTRLHILYPPLKEQAEKEEEKSKEEKAKEYAEDF